MGIFRSRVLAIVVMVGFSIGAEGSCKTDLTFGSKSKAFANCSSLAEQGAELAYSRNGTILEVGFSNNATASGGWIAWGINPRAAGLMDGSSVLIAFSNSTGNYLLEYQLTTAQNGGTAPRPSRGTIFTVLDKAVQISGKSMTFYAKLNFSSPPSKTYVLWNRGSQVRGDAPQEHSLSDLQSYGSIDFNSSGITTIASSGAPRHQLKMSHGILATISWGILLVLGIMSARYLRPFKKADPAWFYLHIFCQVCGYILGISSFGIGVYLGNQSKGLVHHSHRNIGITLFVLATLQILAIKLRLHKDHKHRLYWNIYHHSIGYCIIILAIINIFGGFHILQPGNKWKIGYVSVLSVLGLICIVLEISTWLVWLKNRKKIVGEHLEVNVAQIA